MHPFGPDFKGNVDFLPETYTRAELDEAIAQVPVDAAKVGLFVGTPDDVVEQLRPCVAAGMRYVVL